MVAISEELRDRLLGILNGDNCLVIEYQGSVDALRNAPQAEVKSRMRTHIDLAGAVAVGFSLPIAWANDQTDETLVALLEKIGVETTEVCR